MKHISVFQLAVGLAVIAYLVMLGYMIVAILVSLLFDYDLYWPEWPKSKKR